MGGRQLFAVLARAAACSRGIVSTCVGSCIPSSIAIIKFEPSIHGPMLSGVLPT